MNGTLYVASNTFEEADGVGLQHGGRLATCEAAPLLCLYCRTSTHPPLLPPLLLCSVCVRAGDGDMAHNWTILERTAFVEVTGRHNMGRTGERRARREEMRGGTN